MQTVLDVMIEIRDGLKEKGIFNVPLDRVEERVRDLERQREMSCPGSVEEYGIVRALDELNGLVGTGSVRWKAR